MCVGCVVYVPTMLQAVSGYDLKYLPLLVLSLLPCFLCVQNGRTPVLLAALKGHTSIIELLVDQYHCSLTDIDNVSALDVLQSSHAPLCLVRLMLVRTPLDST